MKDTAFKKISVIDIGSNSVRLFLYDGKNGEKFIEATMLAKHMNNGLLDNESIKRTVNAVYAFARKATSLGYPLPRIFATEAVRAAKNQDVFLSELAQLTPVIPDILTGDEEATICFLGASQDCSDTVGVVDIGGASVEYACGQGSEICYKKSLPIGAITLKSQCGDDRNYLKTYIKKVLNKFEKPPIVKTLIGVSGTLTSLASMDLGQSIYLSTEVHGHKLTVDRLLQLENVIFSDENLLARFKTLQPSRAEIIRQGITLIISLLVHLDAKEIIVSEKDNLEGYIIHKNL